MASRVLGFYSADYFRERNTVVCSATCSVLRASGFVFEQAPRSHTETENAPGCIVQITIGALDRIRWSATGHAPRGTKIPAVNGAASSESHHHHHRPSVGRVFGESLTFYSENGLLKNKKNSKKIRRKSNAHGMLFAVLSFSDNRTDRFWQFYRPPCDGREPEKRRLAAALIARDETKKKNNDRRLLQDAASAGREQRAKAIALHCLLACKYFTGADAICVLFR